MKENLRKAAFFLAASLLSGINIFGQTRSDVIKAYNKGVKVVQTNADSAIIYFDDALRISQATTENTDDIKQNINQTLPGLYLKSASNKFNAKKPGNEVVQAVKLAQAAADKYGNAPVKENAGKLLVQAYNRMATEYFTKKDFEKALVTFDSVLAINPDYLPSIYNKALIYRNQNNAVEFEKTIDLYLGKLGENDKDKAKQASSMALEYFRAAGSKANQTDKTDQALELLNKAAKYGDDKDLFYYFADVYNKQKNFDKGLEYAQKGLAMETGAAEAKAKFYYQIAVAQAAKGQTSEACESFKNAMYGPFADASKAQRTNLKCQ